jgi:hypothetical protein
MLVASDIGDSRAQKVVFGAIWAPTQPEGFLRFEDEMNKLRLKYKCWGKLQWKKSISNENVYNFYRDSMKLFVNSELINFSSIVVDRDVLHRSGQHMGRDINAAKGRFVYLLLSRGSKRYCETGDALHVLLDQGEHSPTQINVIRNDIEHYYLLNQTSAPGLSVDHIQQCDAHIISGIQVADFIIGAISHRMNSTTCSDNHEKLTTYLETKLLQNLSYATPHWHKKVNVWSWTPSRRFSS